MFGVSVAHDPAGGIAKYNAKLSGANDDGVKAMASVLRNQVRKEFTIAGTGRTYRSRKNRHTRALQTSAKRLGAAVRTGQSGSGKTLTLQQLDTNTRKLAAVTRLLGRAIKQGRIAGDLHQASVVGASPSADVGTIAHGIQAGVTDGERRVGDVGGWGGFRALHDGGGRLSGPRPYLENALKKVLPKLSGVFTRIVRKDLA